MASLEATLNTSALYRALFLGESFWQQFHFRLEFPSPATQLCVCEGSSSRFTLRQNHVGMKKKKEFKNSGSAVSLSGPGIL